MLNEHEAPSNSPSAPIGYQPTEDEEKSIALVDRLFEKAKKARKAYDEKWLDNYRMFRGKQWKNARPSYRHSEVINLIFRAIQSEVPILTDAMPRPEFIPQEPGDFELAKIVNDVLDSDWTYNNWSYKFTEAIYDSHLYGTGFGNVDYDSEINEGMGGVTFKSSDPFYQFPDPNAKNVNEESAFYVEAEPKDIDVLKARYPHVAEFLKSDIQDIARRDKAMGEQIRFRSPTDNRSVVEGTSSIDIENNNQALEIVCYIDDMTTVQEEIRESDPKGSGVEISKFVTKLKYPEGRKIVTVSGVLCHDDAIEYDDKKYPYVRLTNYIMPREFWGMSEVEQLESPQKIFNKLISFALDVLTLMGNPIWVVDNTAGVDTDNLFNRPGLVVEKEPGSEVRREAGVELQPYVLQMIDRMKGWFDDVSGSSDVSRGIKPQGVTAASAIEALQDATQTRLRQKSRNIDAFVQDFGQMYLSRVFQFYTVPRVFRVTDDQNVVKYFKFHVDMVDDPKHIVDPTNPQPAPKVKVARVREFNEGEDGKHYLGDEKQYEITRRFDVKVSTGSALPFEKQRVEQQSYALFDRQIIDAEEVLKNIRYPNYQMVSQRMAEKAQAMAATQPPPKP